MPVEEEFEAEFARALRGAAALAPDDALFGLADGAERRGRRRRGRRRAAVAGGVAAVVLVAGGAGVLSGGAGAGLFGGPAAGPVQPMTAEEALQLVTGLLPPGSVESKFAEAPGRPSASRGKHEYYGVLEFDDGKGASVISYSLVRGTQRPDEAARCSDPFTTPQDSCERAERPDGSVVVIEKRRHIYVPDQREWLATWAAPDGTVVRITEYNGQPATPNRAEPPLDAEQLMLMASSPAWARVVAALPANPKAPKVPEIPEATSAPATPPAAELLATLTRLLPPGTTAAGADEQHTTLTVTTGERSSKVSVLAEPAGAKGQQDRKGAEEGLPTPLEVREQLPDGTLVVTNRFGNGKSATDPVLHWTAEVYYRDGRSVKLYEWNGENGYDFRPGEPALSVDQLKAVVLAPDWRK
ncbi:hypothetical protein [Kitasatospora sp. NPDC008115]|uniref:hypothetical protein n=1 Tax=Kitasatospora sp. NPDC008115 TaxID=3364022 RepID=UPI0036EEDD32